MGGGRRRRRLRFPTCPWCWAPRLRRAPWLPWCACGSFAPCEQEQAVHPLLHVVDQHILVFDPEDPSGPPGSVLPARGPKHHSKDLTFAFDRVFGEGATQEEAFQHTTLEVLDSILNGYNCSVFAYGTTGAGKTYAILGSEKSPGIVYLTVVELCRRIEARKEEKSCEVLISRQEVYNEQIHDLRPKVPLAIREDPEKGVVVQGLSFHQPALAEQLLERLANSNKNRMQHPTDANATSSRSHTIFQICVKQQDHVGGHTQDLQVAKMSLIDLAGSEQASVTNTRRQRLQEGSNINRSLLALINVINTLADGKASVTVPSAPVTKDAPRWLQQPAPLSSAMPMAPSPIKRRRRTEMNPTSQPEASCNLKHQWTARRDVEIPWGRRDQGQRLLVRKSQLSSALPGISIWENVQSLLNKQGSSFVPKLVLPWRGSLCSGDPPAVVLLLGESCVDHCSLAPRGGWAEDSRPAGRQPASRAQV
ncbi:LOW QUALITY PROTEIN: kinesin-like protein KIF18B [Rhynochetos jubatus]